MIKRIKILFYIALISSCFMLNSLFAATISLPSTGQAVCYKENGPEVISCSGTGQDGDKKLGVLTPLPRFVDNADGSVTDKLTGLIWLKNANCFSFKIWSDAMIAANSLKSGDCGLTDGSKAGQWQLPNRNELMSLIDRSMSNPALTTGHPFTSVQSIGYWSSSSSASNSSYYYWGVDMSNGIVYANGKGSQDFYVWPVRSGP